MGLKDRDYYWENRNPDGSFRQPSRPGRILTRWIRPLSTNQLPPDLDVIFARLRRSFFARTIFWLILLFAALAIYRHFK
jgi:hypothetical protein